MIMYCSFCDKDVPFIEATAIDNKGQKYPIYIHEVIDPIFGNGHVLMEDKKLIDLPEKEK